MARRDILGRTAQINIYQYLENEPITDDIYCIKSRGLISDIVRVMWGKISYTHNIFIMFYGFCSGFLFFSPNTKKQKQKTSSSVICSFVYVFVLVLILLSFSFEAFWEMRLV